MAAWSPAAEVRSSEVIGRRIFDKSAPKEISLETVSTNIFFDTRYDQDLSLDRLGEGQVHKPTVKWLTPLCDSAAAENGKLFLGWIAAQRKHVKFENIFPDALKLDVDGVDNPYHSLLDRSGAREKAQAFHLSRSLLMSFKENGQLVLPIRLAS